MPNLPIPRRRNHPCRARAAAMLGTGLLVAASAGCADPLVFADWTIPVPEGTRIVEYADGERLFSGMAPPFRWTDAAGDFVYGTRRNEQTEEDEPVRYRLVEPF